MRFFFFNFNFLRSEDDFEVVLQNSAVPKATTTASGMVWGSRSTGCTPDFSPSRNIPPRAIYPPIIPYKIPFFQFHCVVSAAIKESPNNDFSIEYSSYDRNRKQNVLKQFIYRNGSPQSGSDERLTQQPNMYLRKIVLYRALPIDFRF